jgi:hypothetical protein
MPRPRSERLAASAIGLDVLILKATTSREISTAFATLEREQPDALAVDLDPILTSRRVQLVTLAARHAISGLICGS